jgi:hypothetical protein
MKNIGIICDLSYSRHRQFRNYYHALEYLYQPPRIVTTAEGLEGLDILFIGDDHFYNHKPVFTAPGFVDRCNADNIHVVVFTSEKMFGSKFPWNEDNYHFLQTIKNLHHFAYDVDDCEKCGLKLHRLAMSNYYSEFYKMQPENKTNKVLFIGSTKCTHDSYKDRLKTLNEVQKYISIDIFPPEIETWEEYMRLLSKYRFVLSPLGNGNALVTRFYEILLIKSIPIQQVNDNTLKYYDIESKFDDVIYFKNPAELPDKINSCTLKASHSELWLEDYLKVILTKEGLL